MSDPLVTYLNLQSYSPIQLPREDFEPLTVLGGANPTTLEPFGALGELLAPGAQLPAIHRDDSAPSFANRRSDNAGATLNVGILGKLLSAIGAGKLGASAEFAHAASFQYLFLDVLHDYVSLIGLVNALGPQSIVADTFDRLQVPYMYVVTDTLKSHAFGVVAYDANHAALTLDAGALQNLVDVSGGVHVAADADSVVTYSGPKDLRFAFRGKRLSYDPARRAVSVALDDTFLTSRAVGAAAGTSPPDAYDLIAAGQVITVGA